MTTLRQAATVGRAVLKRPVQRIRQRAARKPKGFWARPRRWIESLGSRVLTLFEAAYDGGAFVLATAYATVTAPLYLTLAVEQFYELIVRSFVLVAITASSAGAVLAMQFGLGMTRFGGALYVPTVVGLAIVRAIAPVFTCLMLSARVGAGIAAELGGMAVTQQVDAIRALGSDPVRKLVVPRVLALAFGAPLLTLLADLFGIVGGLVAASASLGISPGLYLDKTYHAVRIADLVVGAGKTGFFGAGIAFIGCAAGLNTREGTVGIGKATTKAVVAGCIFVMLGDVLFTKMAWVFRW